MIEAIPTFYGDRSYRSRLEARWAVFFDKMGIAFEYEPEGFILNDGFRYLPDFFLPQIGWFAEVKPKWFNDIESDKVAAFVKTTRRRILALDGEPGYKSYFGFSPVVLPDCKIEIEPCDFSLDVSQYSKQFTEGHLWGQPSFNPGEPSDNFSRHYQEAVTAALSARF